MENENSFDFQDLRLEEFHSSIYLNKQTKIKNIFLETNYPNIITILH